MITDNYIKMCEQAEEIQNLCEFKKGDWFRISHIAMHPDYELVILCSDRNKRFAEGFLHDYIWLLTLEQLFEIILDLRNKDARIKAKEYEIMADFIDWMLNTDIDQYKDFNLDFSDTKSCILIYLMERFYNKVWTGEKWEKE